MKDMAEEGCSKKKGFLTALKLKSDKKYGGGLFRTSSVEALQVP